MSNSTTDRNTIISVYNSKNWNVTSTVPMILYLVSIIGHSVGFTLLWRVKVTLENQRIILLNLSATEMVFGTAIFIRHVLSKFVPAEKLIASSWFEITTAVMFKFLMLHLAVDRTLDIYLHMRYFIYFPKHRILKILLVMWISSMTISTIAFSLFTTNFVSLYEVLVPMTYLYLALDMLVLLASILSFSYMLSKVWGIISSSHNLTASEVNAKKMLLARKCLLPCLVIGSYIAFNMTSFVSFNLEVAISTKNKYPLTYTRFLMPLGLIADSFIYIFMQHQVRCHLKKVLLSSICGNGGSEHSLNVLSTNCN